MKKVLVSLILIGVLIIPAAASAGLIDDIIGIFGGGKQEAPPESTVAPATDVMTILNNLTNWLFALLLIIAVIFIIVAAFNFVTASGDPEKTKTARNFVLYALIGVLVGIGAKGLVALVRKIGG